MQSLASERKRNQRKSPLTPKKLFKKEESPPAIAMRVGGRVKKAKIPFDPSDVTAKRRQTDSYLSVKKFSTKDASTVQQQQQHCCQCKKFDKSETFINCKRDCNARIHLSCLQSICEHFGKNEEQSWECQNCQTCSVCSKGLINGKSLLKCYICFSSYHMKCHGTDDKIKIIRENRFCCGFCEKSRKAVTPPNAPKGTLPRKTRAFAQTRIKPASTDSKFSSDGKIGFLGFNANEAVESSTDDEGSESTNPERRRSHSLEQRNQRQQRSSKDNFNSIDDETSIPDATEWSSDQVFKYFKDKFPRQAHVFKDHEIDGPSLYLLKRSDIIKGFNIKIGPALKIYSHILKLQTNCNDRTLSWH